MIPVDLKKIFIISILVFLHASCSDDESSMDQSPFAVSNVVLFNSPTIITCGTAVSETQIATVYRDGAGAFVVDMRDFAGTQLWEQRYTIEDLGSALMESILYEGNDVFSFKVGNRLVRFQSDGVELLNDPDFFSIPGFAPTANGMIKRDNGGYIVYGSALNRAWYSTWSEGGDLEENNLQIIGSVTNGAVSYSGCVDLGTEGVVLAGTKISSISDEDHIVFIKKFDSEGELVMENEYTEQNLLPDFPLSDFFSIRLTNMGRDLIMLDDETFRLFLNPQNVVGPFQNASIVSLDAEGNKVSTQELNQRNKNFINGQHAIWSTILTVSQFGNTVIRLDDGTYLGAANTLHPITELSTIDNTSLESSYLYRLGADGQLFEIISLQDISSNSISSIDQLSDGRVVIFAQVASVESAYKPVLIFL